jgi:hypothetical protein
MNSSGYDEMKSSGKRTTHNSIEKFMLTIVWNPRWFHLINVLEKDRKFNVGYYVAEILETLSHCPNGAQLMQRTTIENCWCMTIMRARIPPSYQLNI